MRWSNSKTCKDTMDKTDIKEYYYIDFEFGRFIYPCEVDQRITDYGVLSQYVNNVYTEEEIDAIIAEMIIRHPYIENSMCIILNVKHVVVGEYEEYYHMLNFKNFDYENQERGNTTVKYKYEINK